MKNCSGRNCPMQYGVIDPATCPAVKCCPNATPPLTNADYIRGMTDEELAYWIYNITTDAFGILQIGNNNSTRNAFHWLNWLKQEVKDNE